MLPKFELQKQAKITNGKLEDGYYMIRGNKNEYVSVLFGLCDKHWIGEKYGCLCHSTIGIDMDEAINILTA